jgi:hypothetical protein
VEGGWSREWRERKREREESRKKVFCSEEATEEAPNTHYAADFISRR